LLLDDDVDRALGDFAREREKASADASAKTQVLVEEVTNTHLLSIRFVRHCRTVTGTISDYRLHMLNMALNAQASMFEASKKEALFWYVGARDVAMICEARAELAARYIEKQDREGAAKS
jgi:hypothetical protein